MRMGMEIVIAGHNPVIAWVIWGTYTFAALLYLGWSVNRGQKN